MLVWLKQTIKTKDQLVGSVKIRYASFVASPWQRDFETPEDTVGKRQNAGNKLYLCCPPCFLSINYLNNLAAFNFLSSNALGWDKLGKG